MLSACTAESTRIALESQQRADAVQQFVVEKQHESLRILLFRDLAAKLDQSGAKLTGEQRAALNAAWNDRDLIEFWMIQNERAAALRLAGVDAKLYGDQSVLDLMIKGLETKFDRGKQALAGYAGRALTDQLTQKEEKNHE